MRRRGGLSRPCGTSGGGGVSRSGSANAKWRLPASRYRCVHCRGARSEPRRRRGKAREKEEQKWGRARETAHTIVTVQTTAQTTIKSRQREEWRRVERHATAIVGASV